MSTVPGKITWTQDDYAETGRPGTAKTPMFTIAWHVRTSDPDWTLKTSLPGMTRMEAKRDDKDELKWLAERWLLIFATRIGYADGDGS